MSLTNWYQLCICWLRQATGFGQVKALSCAFYLSGTSRITHTRLASRRRAWKLRRNSFYVRIYVLSNSKGKYPRNWKIGRRKAMKSLCNVLKLITWFHHIFAVFTFGMLAIVPLFYQDLLEQATARLQSPESGEARMVFGRTWRIAPGRLLWEETRWSEIPPTFSISYLPTYLPIHLPICLSLYLSIYLAVCLSVCPSI